MSNNNNNSTRTKGMMGKKRVDIMSPTAMDASSINSIAILIRVRKKISTTKMINKRMPDAIRNTNLRKSCLKFISIKFNRRAYTLNLKQKYYCKFNTKNMLPYYL